MILPLREVVCINCGRSWQSLFMPKLSKVKNRTLAASEVWQAAESVWSVEASAIQRLHETIDPRSFTQCVNAIAQCQGRVLTSGCGTSAATARKIAHSLCC